MGFPERARCVCGVVFGDHLAKAPHARKEYGRIVCTHFRRPLTSRDWPDVWPQETPRQDISAKESYAESVLDRSSAAESSAAASAFESAIAACDCMDCGIYVEPTH